jgi:sodium/bile acid cotransporter 7
MSLLRFISKIDRYLLALMLTVVIATLFPAMGWFAGVMDQVVFFAIALLFFLYGARLSTRAVVEGLFHWRLQGLVFASTFVLFPILGIGLTTLLKPWLDPQLVFGLMFVTVLPSTVQSSIAFTSIARGNVAAALCSASISNLFGMVVTPALVVLLLSSHGNGFSLQALWDIAEQLLLPFVLGQLARPLVGKFIIAHKKLTSYVDRGSILLVVYSAFSAGMAEGIWSQLGWQSILAIIVVDAALLGIVLLVTTYGSRALGFSKEDEITIVFCGSKKSMASGIPMANILFAGQSIGLIVLPLMLFHQLQLFVCAALAQRYARRPVEPALAAAPEAAE